MVVVVVIIYPVPCIHGSLGRGWGWGNAARVSASGLLPPGWEALALCHGPEMLLIGALI